MIVTRPVLENPDRQLQRLTFHMQFILLEAVTNTISAFMVTSQVSFYLRGHI